MTKDFDQVREKWKGKEPRKQRPPLRLKKRDVYFALAFFTIIMMGIFGVIFIQEARATQPVEEQENQWSVIRGYGSYSDGPWHQAHVARIVGETQFKGDCVSTNTGSCQVKLFSYYHGLMAECERDSGGEWEGWIKGISRWDPLEVAEGTVPCDEVRIRVNPLLCNSYSAWCSELGTDSNVFRTWYLDGPCSPCYH